MSPVSSGSAQGVSAQYQTAALKTAQNAQKQEGQAAVSLIQSAVNSTAQSVASGKGASIDVTA